MVDSIKKELDRIESEIESLNDMIGDEYADMADADNNSLSAHCCSNKFAALNRIRGYRDQLNMLKAQRDVILFCLDEIDKLDVDYEEELATITFESEWENL